MYFGHFGHNLSFADQIIIIQHTLNWTGEGTEPAPLGTHVLSPLRHTEIVKIFVIFVSYMGISQ